MTENGIPDDHPLAPYRDELEDHADHLDAFGNVLWNATEDDAQAVMVVIAGEGGTDTLPSVSEDVDPIWASLWMLGAHIHHVADAATAASGSPTSMEHVAKDAIEAMRDHEGPQEVYGDD